MVRPGGQSMSLGVFVRLVGDDDDALGAFGRDLAGDLRHGEAAVVGLAAGHRDGVVEQDLVGDVGVGGDRGADRHDSRNDCRCRRRDSGKRACALENGASPTQLAPSPPICV